MTANDPRASPEARAGSDYWFLAKDRDAVIAVAEWVKTKIDEMIARMAAPTGERRT